MLAGTATRLGRGVKVFDPIALAVLASMDPPPPPAPAPAAAPAPAPAANPWKEQTEAKARLEALKGRGSVSSRGSSKHLKVKTPGKSERASKSERQSKEPQEESPAKQGADSASSGGGQRRSWPAARNVLALAAKAQVRSRPLPGVLITAAHCMIIISPCYCRQSPPCANSSLCST